MKNLDKFRPGIVEWLDAQVCIREELNVLPLMQTCGFIKKLSDRVVVVHLMPPSQEIDNSVYSNIPLSMVKKIRYFE